MAHVTTLPNGTVIIDCPECGKAREAKSFRGNPDHKSGWYTMCHYCRQKSEFKLALGKPSNADWDAVAYVCEKCGGSGRYVSYSAIHGRDMDFGSCYRCKGKGKQTWRDAGRNMSYDSWMAAKLMQGDMRAGQQEKDARDLAEKVVEGLKNVGPSREEVEVKKPLKRKKAKKVKKAPLPKPEKEPCHDEGEEFNERELFNSDEEYAAWKGLV